jgi:integrase
MKGHIRQRGKQSWELKFDAGRDPATGKRNVRFHSFRGTKREAQNRLAELITAVSADTYIEPNKITVATFVAARIDQWEAAGDISARTAQRYRQLLTHQIAPLIGTKLLQKMRPLDVEDWHTALRTTGRASGKGGVSARTVGHAHRVVSKALRDAERNGLVNRNACRTTSAPRVRSRDMIIVTDVAALVEKLRGNRMRVPGMLALFTGMRIGEVLALRWRNVDLEGKVIQVREALEETKAHGIRVKPPKTVAGRRDITLPDILVETLRDHRRSQLEMRIKLGMGKMPDDALLFSNLDGGFMRPGNVSSDWSEDAEALGVPGVTYHGLRHSHASQLIAAGVDIVTVSKRLGHSKPSVTLATYAHLFNTDDRKAAAAINAALVSA